MEDGESPLLLYEKGNDDGRRRKERGKSENKGWIGCNADALKLHSQSFDFIERPRLKVPFSAELLNSVEDIVPIEDWKITCNGIQLTHKINNILSFGITIRPSHQQDRESINIHLPLFQIIRHCSSSNLEQVVEFKTSIPMIDPQNAANSNNLPPTNRAPLLIPKLNDNIFDDGETNTHLDRTLQKMELFFFLFGFKQKSLMYAVVSLTWFCLIGVALPVVLIEISECAECDPYQIQQFELIIVGFQACLAAVSVLCISHNVRKYGIRKFMFVDRTNGHMVRFHDDYVKKISASVRLLVMWILPCLILKLAREVARIILIHNGSLWVAISVLLGLVVSWTYTSTIYLSACVMFHLVCNLQVIHFDDYGELLERESDVMVFMEEHIRLRHHLSKISHRFRIFLVSQFLVVTISLFITLVQTTGFGGPLTIINGGDFAVSSIVQVVGIIICLHGATKISHKAQSIVSLASRWHSLVTCSSRDGSQIRASQSTGKLEVENFMSSMRVDYSESDLESLDFAGVPSHTQLASIMSSYHKRQAFVMYLQANPGGITVYGWAVDRGLITTIFFIELTMATFVLGKTLVLSSS